MNKVSIFEHPEFGRIRTLEIDGKIWFCASDEPESRRRKTL